MPTLRQVAYRKVRLGEGAARRGRSSVASPPLFMDAEQTYIDVERDLQYMGGLLALRPFGWDNEGNCCSLLDWQSLCPMLVEHMEKLRAHDQAARWEMVCAQDRCKVEAYVERRPERKLVGVCPECEPERTAVYAARGERYVVCPRCAAFLDVASVRERYMETAGAMHITRTQSDAARWVCDAAGVRVNGKDLKNWRRRGLIHPRHVDGAYWEWDIGELVACVAKMRNGE